MASKRLRTVSGVLDEDLNAVLDRAGLLEAVEAGIARCAICDTPVSIDSIGGLFVKGGVLSVFCSDAACYMGAVDATTNAR
jgi:hypothetical protein